MNNVVAGYHNWELHKQQVFEALCKEHDEESVNIFMKQYSDRYDKFGRPLLYYKAAFSIFDDCNFVRNNGTKFVGVVGIGGTGKSTLLKNILHFFDDTIKPQNVPFDIPSFMEILKTYPLTNANRSIGLDEPDAEFTPLSKQGRLFKSVIGKIRQQHVYFGICATDLYDIPATIFRKLSTIIFLPCKGKAWLFKDSPKKNSYIIQIIRREYRDIGYSVFFKYKSQALVFDTYDLSPFSKEEIEEYIKLKQADYQNTINKMETEIKAEEEPTTTEYRPFNIEDIHKTRDYVVKKFSEGVKAKQIAEELGIHYSMVRRYIQKYAI